jgi:hypothetical protein
MIRNRMIMRGVRSGVLTWGFCLMAVAVKSDVIGMPLYTIVEPQLSCEQATQLSAQTIARLGYTLTTSVSTAEHRTTLTAMRTTASKQDELTVTISCDGAGARIEAVPELSPCEQANLRVTTGMAQLGFILTSTFPARMGSRGFMQGTRDGPHGQETVTATIICRTEAILMDTPADSPLLKSSEFLQPISDVRRGFFALFKPMAAAVIGE